PGMSWATRTARAPFAHSSRRLTADMSGRAPSAAVAPSPGSDAIGLAPAALGLAPGAPDLGGGFDVMPVGLGEKLLLASRTGFRDDVLEGFHLLGGEPAPLLDDPHACHGGLDGQRAEDAGEERNDQRGAKPEQKRRRMDLHADLLMWRGRYQRGRRGVCYVSVTLPRRPVQFLVSRKSFTPRVERAIDGSPRRSHNDTISRGGRRFSAMSKPARMSLDGRMPDAIRSTLQGAEALSVGLVHAVTETVA